MFNQICTAEYLENLIQGRKTSCYMWVQELLDKGVELQVFYNQLFYPSMVKVGELWMTNEISVAQEHVASAITQHLMSTLYSAILGQLEGEAKGTVLMVCPEKELHEMGARMVADLLEIDGWKVIYLGANTPLSALSVAMQTHKPDVVGISCTIPSHLKEAKNMVMSLRQGEFGQVPIFVGGSAFASAITPTTPCDLVHLCHTFEDTINFVNQTLEVTFAEQEAQ